MSDEKKELGMMFEKHKSQLTKIGIILVVIFAACLVIFMRGRSSAEKKYAETIAELQEELDDFKDGAAVYVEVSKEVDISVINASIQDIGELATVEYLYTDAGKFEDAAELFGKELKWSFTTKSFIAKWDGTIKAGIDIREVYAEENAETKEIIVYLPEAKILSHEIDEDSVETLDQSNGLFNSVKVEDVREFDAISKEAMEEKVMEIGVLDKAFENAKDIIYKLIYTDVLKEQGYTVTFETIK